MTPTAPASPPAYDQHPKLLELLGKKVLILGLGSEGWSTYEFLRAHVPQLHLTVADKNVLEHFPPERRAALEHKTNTSFLLGEEYLSRVHEFDVIFKTPGIPSTLLEIQAAVHSGARLMSNTQLFFELCPGQIIGVTGTKGKSTTAAAIHHVLQTHGLSTALVGNIGRPALSTLPEVTPETLVVFELSSHQLETLTTSPHIAVVQNVTSEHLDYYPTTEAYRLAKTAIAKFQDAQDLIIYNPQFEGSAAIASLSRAKHLRYSLDEAPDARAFVRGDTIMLRTPDQRVTEVVRASELQLPGKHNLLNVLPAVIVGAVVNIAPEEIGAALKTFQPLPHRLELVLTHQRVSYYDDSLATMPEATIGALENFTQPVVLIAGGYERQQDFGPLAAAIVAKEVMGLVLFRPTGERLAEAVREAAAAAGKSAPPMQFADSMPEAVTKAQALISPAADTTGGVVLMSPASASFGTFRDYHDRGEQFKKAVIQLSEHS